jgi:pilus assembly protein Flp/PilA
MWCYCTADFGEENTLKMKKLNNFLMQLRIVKDTKGQDLIEYALMAGFVAVAAGAIMPNVATSISTIFGKISGQLTNAANQGGAAS